MTTDTASIQTQAENAKRPEASLEGNRCERCDAELKREGASIRETLLNAICFLLLLAILAPVGYFAERWIERHLDRPLWHPLARTARRLGCAQRLCALPLSHY